MINNENRRFGKLGATLCFSLFFMSTIFAQKGTDVRPLKNLDNSQIKKYSTYNEYLQARKGKYLHASKAPKRVSNKIRTNFITNKLQFIGSVSQFKGSGTLDGPKKIIKAENGSVKWLRGDLGVIQKSKIVQLADYADNTLQILGTHKKVLGLRAPKDELRLSTIQKDELGYIHIKYQQVHDEIPIWGAELVTHLDNKGKVNIINGNYWKSNFSNTNTPSITANDAIDLVRRDLIGRKRWNPVSGKTAEFLGLDSKISELRYLPSEESSLKLVYEVSLHPNFLDHYTYLIDATSGEVLKRIQESCSIRYENNEIKRRKRVEYSVPTFDFSSLPTSQGSFVDATGIDLNGVVQDFRVHKDENNIYSKAWDLPNIDLTELPNKLKGGGLTLNASNDEDQALVEITSSNNTWSNKSGISAHTNMKIAYDYFNSKFSRKAIDDKDNTIISVINVKQGGEDIDNAYWNGKFISYGNGKDTFTPLAGALDVAGHEMSHGVVEHTAGLIYEFQSGALNESFSDIFGVLIEDEDYLIGEDIMKEGQGVALRDLLNPNNSSLYDQQPAHMDEYKNLTIEQDAGGVHINSGIPNRAAALIIEAIGNEKTSQIYYRALSSYLTRKSNFSDARLAVEQSTIDLYGEGAELASVKTSFDAVGINIDSQSDYSDNDVEPVIGGSSLITYMNNAGTIGLLDITDPDNLESIFYQATARFSAEIGSFSQLTTPLTGESIWYINSEGYLEYIEVETGKIASFSEVYINSPGDLWNAAISPNGEVVALVSAYEGDNNLYFFDGESLGYIELIPLSTQQEVKNNSIDYPEIISWSSNMEEPKIAFDAYHSNKLGSETLGYWSIYEIDFSSENIYSLYPNQSQDIQTGNITYSKTNPDIIAFNEFNTKTDESDVIIVDYEENVLYDLNISSVTVLGNPIIDAQAPSFSPSDEYLAFASIEFPGFFFVDLETAELDYLAFEEPVFAQNWFMFDGQQATGIEDSNQELPKEFVLHNNYPNPFNPSTQVSFEIPNNEHITLEVYDVLGRKVASIVNKSLTAGKHSFTFNADGLPSGLYITRLSSGSKTFSKKMMLIK